MALSVFKNSLHCWTDSFSVGKKYEVCAAEFYSNQTKTLVRCVFKEYYQSTSVNFQSLIWFSFVLTWSDFVLQHAVPNADLQFVWSVVDWELRTGAGSVHASGSICFILLGFQQTKGGLMSVCYEMIIYMMVGVWQDIPSFAVSRAFFRAFL